jgi:hypothetical protein
MDPDVDAFISMMAEKMVGRPPPPPKPPRAGSSMLSMLLT